MTKWVYNFGNGKAEGCASDIYLLGGKGAMLAEMSKLGLPVPAGFTITTKVCTHYHKQKSYPKILKSAVKKALAEIALHTKRQFGAFQAPLLLSVRSGAPASMPGMMDTVLNIGLNDKTVKAIARDTGDARFAYDSYRRFIEIYAHVVLGIEHDFFEEILDDVKQKNGFKRDTDLSAKDWQAVIIAYKACVQTETNGDFPQNVEQQLWGAIGAVFNSWYSARAVIYRRLHNIPDEFGTAVNVQSMVFGNRGNDSATGVAFTRNPNTGKKEIFGEFLLNAQGEDVVAGIRTPHNITESARIAAKSDHAALEKLMPEIFAELCAISDRLDRHFGVMQDIEFTIEQGKLWILQTRSGKCTTKAAIKIAVEMVKERVISKEDALLKIKPQSLDQLLHKTISPDGEKNWLGSGLPASPGAATGEIVFNSEQAEAASAKGRKAILLRVETSPEDIQGMHCAEAILTSRGGMTSHAAVVARGMGKACVTGASQLRIDYQNDSVTIAGQKLHKGDVITIDGSQGHIYLGHVDKLQPELSGDFAQFIGFADEIRQMKILANAETTEDIAMAQSFGAEGIGLCRTEQMFYKGQRIFSLQKMILSENEAGRRQALSELLPEQIDDFYDIFSILRGLPITIRLFDPPLKEFLPKTKAEIAQLAQNLAVSEESLQNRIEEMHEDSPILGLRGCRLAIVYPEIIEMQARAIFFAAAKLCQNKHAKNSKNITNIEIMVPFISLKAELDFIKEKIDNIAALVKSETGVEISYVLGAMIEVPRAALHASDIAKTASFFSFGTNDLTQTTFGISRNDGASFFSHYLKANIIAQDPFVSIDEDGVGAFMEMAAKFGRKTRKNLVLGICGEQGGEANSIEYFAKIAMDYVSCSPFRIAIAKLAAAQAVIKQRK